MCCCIQCSGAAASTLSTLSTAATGGYASVLPKATDHVFTQEHSNVTCMTWQLMCTRIAALHLEGRKNHSRHELQQACPLCAVSDCRTARCAPRCGGPQPEDLLHFMLECPAYQSYQGSMPNCFCHACLVTTLRPHTRHILTVMNNSPSAAAHGRWNGCTGHTCQESSMLKSGVLCRHGNPASRMHPWASMQSRLWCA